MVQIRKSVFETNSSSTHSLCISKGKVEESALPKTVHFELDHYGWEADQVEDTASYLYTAIMDLYDEDLCAKCFQRLKDVLEKYGIKATFEDPNKDEIHYWGIDHVDELEGFIDRITQDEDLLLRFLFHPASCVYTGNDNSREPTDMCNCAESTIIERNTEKGTWSTIPNPNHDPENFEYYYKSN